jgi:hypothetical protein
MDRSVLRSVAPVSDPTDEAGAGNQLTVWLLRHSQRKRRETDRPNLRSPAPVLDPTISRVLVGIRLDTQLLADRLQNLLPGTKVPFRSPYGPLSKQELNRLNLSEQKKYINLGPRWPGSNLPKPILCTRGHHCGVQSNQKECHEQGGRSRFSTLWALHPPHRDAHLARFCRARVQGGRRSVENQSTLRDPYTRFRKPWDPPVEKAGGYQKPCHHRGSGWLVERSLSVRKLSWISPGDSS